MNWLYPIVTGLLVVKKLIMTNLLVLAIGAFVGVIVGAIVVVVIINKSTHLPW